MLHGFAQVFAAIGDRTSPRRAKLAANQARLDEISSSLSVADAAQAIRLLHRCLGEDPDREALAGPDSIQAKAEAWHEAEELGIQGDVGACARAFASVAGKWPNDAMVPYAFLAAAQWLHYAGHYREARQAYAQTRSGGAVPAFYADYGLAELLFAQGEYDDAFRQYARLSDRAVGERMGEWLACRQAQCLEFQGSFDQALDAYRAIAASADLEQAALAQFAIRRIAGTADEARPVPRKQRTVAYVGEDRATRGDWWTYYGGEAFILCAQHSPRDVAGELPGWSVKGRTGDPREVMRYWSSGAEESHASFLWDPMTGKRRAANWDDRGEVYARGSGPDLWLDITVPTGGHRLSLYFLNDANYYEPDRVYVISVYGADGTYQTGTEVRHFVNGVYKQFTVSGPAKLSVRIERGLSLNVLLAGVFLDSLYIPELPSCFRRQKEWENERIGHWSSADEQETLVEAIAERRSHMSPAVLGQALEELATAETYANRVGPSYWVAMAQGELLAGESQALADHYRRLADLCLVPRRLAFPSLGTTIVAKPYAEAAFARYVAVLLPTMGGEEAREFCRRTAREAGNGRSFRGHLAYAELARSHGEVPLMDEDLFLLASSSGQATDVIGRLEAYRKQTGGRALAAHLELALLSAYLRADQPDQAVTVARRIETSYQGSDAEANALYLLWHHFSRRKQDASAAVYRQELQDRFPAGSWERLARKEQARKGEPLGDQEKAQ